jgi:2',3'-cyclic-nucleotide 2'-phosphodiesterase (5'-nucleotidase family)
MKNGNKTRILALILALSALFLASCGVSKKCNGNHKDKDDDGFCDSCNRLVLVYFDFYALNDLHGKFSDTDSQPGVDELTTYIEQARDRNPNIVLLASGDMWQGSPESNLTSGNMMTEWMNRIGFDAMTLGNHEFDWGEEAIIENEALAEFPFLAINIYDKDTDKRVEYCDSSVIIELNGVTVGIIGAMGDCYSSIAPDKVEDVYFVTGDELTELVKAESTRLRAEGVDFIVYSLHDGGTNGSVDYRTSYYDIELSRGYVDLVFEGHTHKSYVKADGEGVYHLQGGGDNDGITYAYARYNTANGKKAVLKAEFVRTSAYYQLSDSPIIKELLDKYNDEIVKGNEVLGTTPTYRNSDYLRDVIAQLYYEKGVELWGDQYDIVLGGGYMSARSPYDLEAGEITYGHLYSIFPFDNNLVLCSIKGSDLKKRFFNSDSYYIYYDSYGESVKNNYDPNGIYYIIVDSYSSSYAPNRLTEIARFDEPVYARDLLAEYIKQGGLSK